MKGKTVNRSLPPPVQCREGFFIPLQYPRQELLVALAHLVLVGRLRAASVMNFVVDREKFQKKRRTRRALPSYPPRGCIWLLRWVNSVFAWGIAMMKVADSRIVMALTCTATVLLMLASQVLLFAQFQIQVVQIDLSPPDAADNDVLTFRLTGIWWNGCCR